VCDIARSGSSSEEECVSLVKGPEIGFMGLSVSGVILHISTVAPALRGKKPDPLSVEPMGSIMGKQCRLDCREMG